MATHATQLVPRFGELDPYNHVNHAVYVSYFEAARCLALESADLALPDLSDQNVQILVTHLEVRFRQPATARDTLRIETELVERRRASTRWQQRILRVSDNGEDTVLVEAHLTAAICDNNGRPRRPPPGLMNKFDALAPS